MSRTPAASAPEPAPRWPAPRWPAARVALFTALAYAAAGQLALLLALPPAHVSPLFPAAGLALAVQLVHGRAAVPGVLLGALLVDTLLSPARAIAPLSNALVALAIAVANAAQAAVGSWLVRQHGKELPTLGEPRDVVRFALLGAGLSSTLSASVAVAALSLGGAIGVEDRLATWWTWWLGDALGVLIGTPVVLAWIGQPRADWASRRLTLALPLLVAGGLLAGATSGVLRWDAQRVRSVFERDADHAAAALESQLQAALHTLEAMRGVFQASDDPGVLQFRRAAAPWLGMAAPAQAIGYAERLPRSAIAEFEARVQAQDGRTLRVFDRNDDRPSPAAGPSADDEVMAIRFIEPEDRNAAALGVNSNSVPSARAAIERSVLSDSAAATVPFVLTQVPGDESGVVVYRALYGAAALTQPDARRAAVRGVVFVSLRMQAVLEAARRSAQPYLGWCLVDADTHTPRRRVAGAPGCEQAATASDGLRYQRAISFAGRRWDLVLSARAAQVPDAGRGNAWLFSLAGLLASALLSALLLVVTGRTRRIEAAVAARTADLQHEVSERERTERALRDSERRFRNIFDQAPLGIAYADLDGQVREGNPRLREMAGLTAEALAQRRIVDLLQRSDRAAAAEQLARLKRGEQPEVWLRARLRRHDAQALWAQIHCSVLLDAVGRPERLVVLMEDITAQRKHQEAEQGRALAESANRAKSEFLSRMSHELRTPLNAMLGFAQLLELDRRQPLATHQAGWVAQILRAGWHLLDMINDTLDLSRIEAGELRLRSGPLALAPLVSHCVAMAETAAAQRSIQVLPQLDPGAPRVLADETRLRQVLSNLLSNAIKYNVDEGRVTLTSRLLDDGATVELRVCDTGLGLTEAQMAELFQPFNRLGRENGSVEGTGIGLVISRRLAELMGGSLHAEPGGDAAGGTRGGHGATFVLRLPAAQQAFDDTTVPLRGPLAQGAAASPHHNCHVHYIEDNETNVEVLRGILLQRPQVRLTVSHLGLEGLEAVRTAQPDLLLLDMHLPDIDGLDLLARLRQDPASAHIPVVAVSADATATRIEQALAAGARHYLTKPLDLGSFLSVLDSQLAGVDKRAG